MGRISRPYFPSPAVFSASAGSAILTPDVIFGSDLIAWYRADSGLYSDHLSTPTPAVDNDGVVLWYDKTANASNLSNQASSDSYPTKPTLDTTGLNSKPTLSFNAADHQYFTTFDRSESYSLVGMSSALAAMFFVGQMNSGAGDTARCVGYVKQGDGGDYSSSASAAFITRDGTANGISLYRSGLAVLATKSITLNSPRRFGCVWDGANVTLYENNVPGTPQADTASFASPGTLLVGVSSTGSLSGSFSGLISEIVVVANHSITSGELNSLDAYFVDFWGF